MQKFLTNKSKIFFLAFAIIAGALLISAIFYATQYANIHVYFTATNDGNVISMGALNEIGLEQTYLYNFFEKTTDKTFSNDFTLYQDTVYKFQRTLSSTNDFIVTAGLVSLICAAGLFVLSNHSRKIYYKSNLIGGILLPLVVVVMNIILIVKHTNLISMFNEGDNYELFNRVSLLQTTGQTQITASQMYDNICWLQERYTCDNTTFIIYIVISIFVIVYALFMIFLSVYRYKESTERRNQVLERAVSNND